MLTLTERLEGGRGVWESVQGDVLRFSSCWQVTRVQYTPPTTLSVAPQIFSVGAADPWAISQSSSLCPASATFLSGEERVELSCH